MKGLLFITTVGGLIIYIDAVWGPIFPDKSYCYIGAGKIVAEAGPTLNLRTGKMDFEKFWYGEHCSHNTIWDAIKQKIDDYNREHKPSSIG